MLDEELAACPFLQNLGLQLAGSVESEGYPLVRIRDLDTQMGSHLWSSPERRTALISAAVTGKIDVRSAVTAGAEAA
jgi:hypothetical protein